MPYEIRGKCIYRKDTGKKVGCTDGDVHKYMAALQANTKDESQEYMGQVDKHDKKFFSPETEMLPEDMGGTTADIAVGDMPVSARKGKTLGFYTQLDSQLGENKNLKKLRIEEAISKVVKALMKEDDFDYNAAEIEHSDKEEHEAMEQIAADVRRDIENIDNQLKPKVGEVTDENKKKYEEFEKLMHYYDAQMPETLEQLPIDKLQELQSELKNFIKIYKLEEPMQEAKKDEESNDEIGEFAFRYKGDIMVVKGFTHEEARDMAVEVMSKFRKIKGMSTKDIEKPYILTFEINTEVESEEDSDEETEEKD